MFSVDTTLTQDAALAVLRAIQGRAANLGPFFLERIRPDITTLMEQQFASEGTRLGEAWAPLAPSTVARKGHGSILEDTMQMFTAWTNPDAEDGYERVTDQTYRRGVTGFAADKTVWHTEGTSRGLPSRPVLGAGVPESVSLAWASQLATYLATGLVPPQSSAVASGA